MAHIYDDPAEFKDDATAGFLLAYDRYVEPVPGASAVMRRGGPREGKVSVIIGGGSGHYPAFCGTVGAGLADAAVIGDIFTSPSNEQAYRTGKALDGGAGVLFSFGNYAGDVMNFGAAQDRLRTEGVDCRTVLVTDDVASAARAENDKRRGIAGDFVVFKIAGAAADRGDSLDEVERLARLANANTFTFGVAFAGCTMPGADEPLFTVPAGIMELGLGIHGEPGIKSVAHTGAKELAGLLLDPIMAERPAGTDGRVAVIVNGLGGTKYEELFILYGHVHALLDRAGLRVVMPEVGELVTSLDMGGASLTVSWLDDELEELWSAPADTPAFRRGSVADLPTFVASPSREVDAISDEQETAAGPASLAAAQAACEVLDAMLAVVEQNAAELGRIDAVAGDGDHGTGMVRGLRAATKAAHASNGGAAATLDAAGLAFGDKAGGTSGMLWGLFLQAIAVRLGNAGRPSAQDLVDGVVDGVDALARVGKASAGDKTMMDVLFPFRDALVDAVSTGKPLAEAWAGAADVASQAAVDTAAMVPKVGRARPLAERSVGTPDAGATSMALCLHTVTPVLTAFCSQGGAR